MKNKNHLAPIVLFVYNRPWHTQQTIRALQKNNLASISELFIYSDGYKEDDKKNVLKVRKFLRTINGFKNIVLIEQTKNKGLADSIISGVSEILSKYDKIIVLEDDIVVSKSFLDYMNLALNQYTNVSKVHSVTAYSHIQNNLLKECYFLSLTSSWSWATWKDRWDLFHYKDLSVIDFLATNKKKFTFDHSYPYDRMVLSSLSGKIDSWAVWFYYSMLKNDLLTLYPQQRLAINIGFDGSGTHCGYFKSDNEIDNKNYTYNLPTKIIESHYARELHKNIFLKQ